MSQNRPPFIFLAAPCYGGMLNLHFMRSVMALETACAQRGVGLHVELLPNDPLITRARSRLAAQFLAHPDATHILFCDVDIGFEPHEAFKLLDSGKDVVAAVCPLKHIDWENARRAAQAGVEDLQSVALGYVVRFLPTPDNSVEVENGVAKVAYGGTGFLMISRAAMQQVVDAHPELTAIVDEAGTEAVMVFDTLIEPETGQHLSEDYAFCRRWRELGGEIWANVEARMTHAGHMAYTGSLIAAMRQA
ncbi:hypothetical protein [Phenylobacterium deserti]|uniref:Glycosyltransferase n=1 Tax=Phenylobacterium deserti TaxID=1914756 RepID=A0A328AQJ4_9CAUL|nr:hypothetical protein [Phenylobacterium deserti]RAK57283.1 hypothetical protein DJ018_04870 [Phenylobacterium deserti]